MQKASKNAANKYKEMSGRTVEVKLEEGLNDDEAGGVIGSAMGGKIKIDNTLAERLKLLEEKVSRGIFLF
jgi:V-type H+-transporting ATPase subunit E